MSALKWKILEEGDMRQFITEQDMAFQRAMRAAHGVPKPKLSLVPPAVVEPPVQPAAAPEPVSDEGLSKISYWKEIIREVCEKHTVTRGELLGHQRQQRIVIARHEAMYRMKKETTMSLPAIGRRLGGKDHSTVINAVRKHQQRIEAAGL